MTKYNIMAARPYRTKQGEDKTRWVKLGSCVMTDEGKMFGDLDAIPAGAWFDGSIQFFVQEERQQQPQQPQQGNYNTPQGYGQQPQHTDYRKPQQQPQQPMQPQQEQMPF